MRSGLLTHFFVLRITAGSKNDTVLRCEFVLIANLVGCSHADHAAFIVKDKVLDAHAEFEVDALFDSRLIQRINQTETGRSVKLVSTLPKSAGALADTVHYRRSLGLHPVQCVEYVVGILSDQRNVTDFIAAVIGLEGMPFGAVKECLRAALQVGFVFGFDVCHQLGVFFADGFFADCFNHSFLQCFRHRKGFLSVGVSCIKCRCAAKCVSADHRHLFQNQHVLNA